MPPSPCAGGRGGARGDDPRSIARRLEARTASESPPSDHTRPVKSPPPAALGRPLGRGPSAEWRGFHWSGVISAATAGIE